MNEELIRVITIDGPSGSGKGTLSFLLSQSLSWNVLDSGAIYRALAYSCHSNHVDLLDEDKVVKLAKDLKVYFQADKNGEIRCIYQGEDISNVIRTEQSGKFASKIARMPRVRDALIRRQQDFRKLPGLIADGRDMGTVVFPDAILKIFLSADENVRVSRRHLQLMGKGENVSLARLQGDIESMDKRDTSRKVSPLVPAEDALIIDSTDLSATEVFERVLNELRAIQVL